jgi:hypothetical protein
VYIGLHENCPLFLPNFNGTSIFSTDFRKKYSNIKFYKNPGFFERAYTRLWSSNSVLSTIPPFACGSCKELANTFSRDWIMFGQGSTRGTQHAAQQDGFQKVYFKLAVWT